MKKINLTDQQSIKTKLVSIKVIDQSNYLT